MKTTTAIILGIFIFLSAGVLGYTVWKSTVTFKAFERTVTVKGLAEKESPADIVIWPIKFTEAGNDLTELYQVLENRTAQVKKFLSDHGIKEEQITISPPAITDKWAQSYGTNDKDGFRYTAVQAVTAYSGNVEQVREAINQLVDLGREGIVFMINDYDTQAEYIFTKLNELKPGMIEEATRNAREIGEKFAKDSESKLGKIKQALQGQFSIIPRDKNNPHIKIIRVVSTVEYYLSD
jgi:hypothetical protein